LMYDGWSWTLETIIAQQKTHSKPTHFLGQV
jgi:hypothetical protein